MTQEGATIYYSLKQVLNFEKVCSYLQELGLSIRNPDTQLITGILANGGDFEDTSLKKAQALFELKNFGFYLWLENGHIIFWSSVQQNNYYFHNFAFNSLDGDEIEQKASNIFIKFALQQLKADNRNFLGFTLDQFGNTEEYNFSEIFDSGNQEILSSDCIPELLFLPREKIQRITVDSKSQMIKINQNFDCIAKNQKLADYLKSLL